MTQTRDLIKKTADFFTGEEFYEKGEDARLELSPDDVRCMNEVIKACGNAISRQWLMECVNEGWIKFETEKDKNRFIHLVRDMAPPVTPQPKTGHWIYDYTTADGHRTYHCSECGCFLKPKHSEPLNSFKWCSLCGTKMIESQESER